MTSKKQNRSDRPLLSNHQKSWLWGTIPVLETLRSGSWPVYELILSETADSPAHRKIISLAESQRIELCRQSSRRLEQLSKAADHQGVLALMGPFPYADLESLLASGQKQQRYLILDRIQDPFNFGAICRSAAAFGFHGILIGTEKQVGVTSHVARSSVGMVNHVSICKVDSLNEAVQQLKQRDCKILIADQTGAVDLKSLHSDASINHSSVALILGNEAEGVADEIASLRDKTVRIPMQEQVESLNAAVSAAIMMYELSTIT